MIMTNAPLPNVFLPSREADLVPAGKSMAWQIASAKAKSVKD